MPRLGISVSEGFMERKAPRPDQYGRRIRHVDGVQQFEEKSSLIDPLFLKLAAGLAILAMISMGVALVRLFTFPH